MDVVKALALYRKSIIQDETAFQLLCLLYKDGNASEAEISRTAGFDNRIIHNVLRELYQANFVRLHSGYRFGLTNFGEEILSHLGVSGTVARFILDEVLTEDSARWSRILADLAFAAEPQRAHLATQSLKNLRVFISYNKDISDDVASSLAFHCISPRTSVFGSLFDAKVGEKLDSELPWREPLRDHSETTWQSIAAHFTKKLKPWRSTDLLILHACEYQLPQNLNIADDVASHLSFRLFNYINSRERDHLLELCLPRIKQKNRELISLGLRKRFVPLEDFISHEPGEAAKHAQNQLDLWSLLADVAEGKTRVTRPLQVDEEADLSGSYIREPPSKSDLIVALENQLNNLKTTSSNSNSKWIYRQIRGIAAALERATGVEDQKDPN